MHLHYAPPPSTYVFHPYSKYLTQYLYSWRKNVEKFLYEKKIQKLSFTPSQRTLKYGSEKRPKVRGLSLIILFTNLHWLSCGLHHGSYFNRIAEYRVVRNLRNQTRTNCQLERSHRQIRKERD